MLDIVGGARSPLMEVMGVLVEEIVVLDLRIKTMLVKVEVSVDGDGLVNDRGVSDCGYSKEGAKGWGWLRGAEGVRW